MKSIKIKTEKNKKTKKQNKTKNFNNKVSKFNLKKFYKCQTHYPKKIY